MRLNRENKDIRVVKVPLQGFIATLMELYDLGIEHVDFVITPDKLQDQIGIVIRDDEKPSKELTQEDINRLLE